MFANSSLLQKVQDFSRRLFAPPQEPLRQEAHEWYAGLCVDPHTFSDQLGRLQESLRGSGHSKGLERVEKRAESGRG